MKSTLHEIALVVTRPKQLQRHRKEGTQTKPGKALFFVFHREKSEAKNVKFEASEALWHNIVNINTNINANHILLSLCVTFLLKKLQQQNLMFWFISTRIAKVDDISTSAKTSSVMKSHEKSDFECYRRL